MPGSPGPQRTHRYRATVVILYAFVIAASAFFHNDFTCRQDSRTHCISCTVSQDAQRTESHGGPLDGIQRLAGRVELRTQLSIDIPSVASLSDRAPPA